MMVTFAPFGEHNIRRINYDGDNRMVVDKILNYISPNSDKLVVDSLMDQFTDDVIHGVMRQVFKKNEHRASLRLSGIGKCLRGQSYTMHGYPRVDNITPRTKMTFLFGDIVEALVVLLAKQAGVIITDEQKEVKLNGVKGHIDGIVRVPYVAGPGASGCGNQRDMYYLFECKSMSDASFRMFKRDGMNNSFGYVSQANSYAHALGLDGILWVGMNKNTGHLHEEFREVDQGLVDETISNIDILRGCTDPTTLQQYDTVEETWYKKPTGNTILPFQCSYCNFNETCWGDKVTKFERGGKIKYYVGDVKQGAFTKGGRIIE